MPPANVFFGMERRTAGAMEGRMYFFLGSMLSVTGLLLSTSWIISFLPA